MIERTERSYVTNTDVTCAAMIGSRAAPAGKAASTPARYSLRIVEEAAAASRARRDALAGWAEPLSRTDFSVTPPVLNSYTRLAVATCPAAGILRVVGYDCWTRTATQPVTQMREIREQIAA